MFIDIVFLVLIAMAIFKGYSKGLIVAVFSFAAIIIGTVAALKLSSVVASWLQSNTNIGGYWLPLLSFLVVMVGVIFLVRMGAAFVEKTFQMAMLGWVNKIGGIVLYALLYLSLFSVILFYCNKMHILKADNFVTSKTYDFVAPFAPKVIEIFSAIIPVFKDVFEKLSSYFDQLAKAAK